MTIKISVIVPVYNVEKYLKACLKSLVNQTLKDIEIICVNDGSTDNSPAILDEFAEKYPQVKIINKANGGISSARNTGIREAQGEYIGFVDSDDRVSKDFYKALYDCAKKYNSDIACSNIVRCGKIIRKYKLKYKKEASYTDDYEKLKIANIPKHNYVWNKIYKRDALLNLNIYFPENMVYEDIYWSTPIICALKNLSVTTEGKYYYKKRKGSITTQKSNEADCNFANTYLIKFLEDKNLTHLFDNHKIKKDKIKCCKITIFLTNTYYSGIKKYYLLGFLPMPAQLGEILAKQLARCKQIDQ